jgi:hypothetical protein
MIILTRRVPNDWEYLRRDTKGTSGDIGVISGRRCGKEERSTFFALKDTQSWKYFRLRPKQ